MSEGLNRVMLLGNIGSDPELRYTQGGQAVLHLRMATTESYLDKDKVRQERTDWHNVTVWGKRGEGLGKILAKGSLIFVEGSLRTSSYDDKKSGEKRYKTEVVATNVILGGRGQGRAQEQGEYQGDGQSDNYDAEPPALPQGGYRRQEQRAPAPAPRGAPAGRAPARPASRQPAI